MREPTRLDRSEPERAILVGVLLAPPVDSAQPLDELAGLAATAGTQVVAELIQRREHPDQTTYLGKGKVKELEGLGERHDADVVIFDNDLSPAQTRNLEQALAVKVIDR